MRFYYSDRFNLTLPAGHRFPARKYEMLRRQLLHTEVLRPDQIHEAPMAARADLERAHDPDYVGRVEAGALTAAEMRRIGLPWSAHLVNRSKTTVGGALAAAQAALETGFSGQMAGGTHHAHRDFGAGYCVFNDFAVVALTALQVWGLSRVAIIDLDVHQGDGNAAILAGHPGVFVFSMHGEKNFPHRKVASDLDVGLPDATEDELYLETLAARLPQVFAFEPQLVLYQAGVDPLAEDRLGRLNLSFDGLKRRDEMVFAAARAHGAPVSMAMGGGYAKPIEASVTAYANTYAAAKAVYGF